MAIALFQSYMNSRYLTTIPCACIGYKMEDTSQHQSCNTVTAEYA